MNRTRSSENWSELPGGFDTVNTRFLYPTDNRFQIPVVTAPSPALLAQLPERLIPYRVRVRNQEVASRYAVHGFRDDYRLEALWSRPQRTLSGLRPFGAVLTPDFSLYRDWPYAVQLWNTYRSRWLGAFWQSQGLRVIPSVSWSSPKSYEFCFLGLPQHSLVAIASVMIKRDRIACRLFSWGFEAMLQTLQPSIILCYGALPDPALERLAEQGPYPARLVSYPFQWEENRSSFRAAKVATTKATTANHSLSSSAESLEEAHPGLENPDPHPLSFAASTRGVKRTNLALTAATGVIVTGSEVVEPGRDKVLGRAIGRGNRDRREGQR